VFSILHYSIQAQMYRKRILADGWRAHGPSLVELDEFIDARRLPIHDKPFKKVTPSYLELLAAYRVQFAAIRNMIDTGTLTKDEWAMVSVAAATPER
jgi:hypothetical protein